MLVTHDLGVIAEVADRVLTMYAGRIVERASATEVFTAAHHPYTRALLECVPSAVPGAAAWCRSRASRRAWCDCRPAVRVRARCPHVEPQCRERMPPLQTIADGHVSECVLPAGRRRRRQRRPGGRSPPPVTRPRPRVARAAARHRPRQALPGPPARAVRPPSGRARRRWRGARGVPRRDPRPRRRVRVGQVDPRPAAGRADRADGGCRRDRRQGPRHCSTGASCGRCGATCR